MARASSGLAKLLRAAEVGRRPDSAEALALLVEAPAMELLPVAESLTLAGFGETVTYSRKVFIPLTQLCRDVCHYCTFAKAPRGLNGAYLTAEEVLAIARAGKAADCKEALFTLGDQPEERYAVARTALDALGAASTLDYLERMAKLVLEETGLLPHLNPGVMGAADLRRLRAVSASMGLMLESASGRLCERGGPHFGSPDKVPARRLATLRAAGELRIPMTTGLLIGIGETRRERVESLLALRELQDAHANLQEIIVQNFRAKPGTKMAAAPEPVIDEQLWTVAVARLLFGPNMSIQAPPNLQPEGLGELVPRRHQRLGWSVAGDARPREPRGALATSGRSCACYRCCRAGSGRAPGARARLCGAARSLDGSEHYAPRAPAERQSRFRATGSLVRRLSVRIAADRSALVSGRVRASSGRSELTAAGRRCAVAARRLRAGNPSDHQGSVCRGGAD